VFVLLCYIKVELGIGRDRFDSVRMRYRKTASGLPGPDAVSKKKAGQSGDRSAMRVSFQRLQTIQPWRKLPPAPPAGIEGFVRVSFHNAITLHPFFENVNRVSRLFSDFLYLYLFLSFLHRKQYISFR
jgi:hypothetical protein